MQMLKRVTFLNIISSILLQLITTVSGLVIPRTIITIFGSDVNGLLSSINQFLNCFTLMEGGVTGVILACLYKPVANYEFDKISGIISAAKIFYRIIGLTGAAYVLMMAIIYPIFLSDYKFSYIYIFTLVLILGINILVQYIFSLTYILLLKADRRIYLVAYIQMLVISLNTIILVVATRLYPNIHIVKLISGILFIMQPVLFNIVIRRKYKLDFYAKPNKEVISQRWNGFGQNLAAFIHINADVVLLTIFTDLSWVSIYAVYNMVAQGIKAIVIAVSSAIVPSIGNMLAKRGDKDINNAVSLYEFWIFVLSTVLFTCGILLIIPFVLIYTKGVYDANYNQPFFGVILLLSEYLYCCSEPYVNIAYAAGHFKQTSKYAYIEAIIKIFISVSLVKKYGLIGVASGTFFAILIRMVCQVYYLSKNITFRSMKFFLEKITFFLGISIIIIVLSNYIFDFSVNNLFKWVILAIQIMILSSIITLLASSIYFGDEIKILLVKINNVKRYLWNKS